MTTVPIAASAEITEVSADRVAEHIFHAGVAHLRLCAPYYHVPIYKQDSPLLRLVADADPLTTTELCLETYIGNRGVVALCDVIRFAYRGLQVLRLPHLALYAAETSPSNISGNTAIQAMCSLLSGHPSLQTLDISRSDIGVGVLRHLVLFAKATPTLTSILLEDTPIEPSECWQLAAVLRCNMQRIQTQFSKSIGSSPTRRQKLADSGQLTEKDLSGFLDVLKAYHDVNRDLCADAYDPDGVVVPPSLVSFSINPSTSTSMSGSTNSVAEAMAQAAAAALRRQRNRCTITYVKSRKEPHLLSQTSLRCIRERSAGCALERSNTIPFPRPLSNLACSVSSDGKARALPFTVLSAEPWRRLRPKAPEEREKLRRLIHSSAAFQALRRAVFPPPPPPPPDSSKVDVAGGFGGVGVAEGDYQDALKRQALQQEEIIDAIADVAHLARYRLHSTVWDARDTCRNVYMIDPEQSPANITAYVQRSRPGRLQKSDASAVESASENPSLTSPKNNLANFEPLPDRDGVDLFKSLTIPAGQFFGFDSIFPVTPTAAAAPSSPTSSLQSTPLLATSATKVQRRTQCTLKVTPLPTYPPPSLDSSSLTQSPRGRPAHVDSPHKSHQPVTPTVPPSAGDSSPDSRSTGASPLLGSSVHQGAAVHLWTVPIEAFQLFFAEPLFAQRFTWRRLIDAMPCLLGADPILKQCFADCFASNPMVIYEKDLPEGRVTLSSTPFPSTLSTLNSHLILVEEGHLVVRRSGVEMSSVGRGEVISLCPSAPRPQELVVGLQEGNMPAWRIHLLHLETLRCAAPYELYELLVLKSAKRFEQPDPKGGENSLAASWRRRR